MDQANSTGTIRERGAAHAGILVGVVVALVVTLLVAVWAAMGPALLRTDESIAVTGDPERDLPGLRERSVIRTTDGTAMAVLADEFDREVVALERIPEHVRQAVITAEDRDFYSHGGYDAGAIVRAAWANLLAGSVEQGGSTITQQLARINFLDNDQTMARKMAEVSVARALEDAYSKDELLERYLNQVYLGAGSYGFQAGAQQFFRTLVEDLTVEQGALLAGMIRTPTHLNPRRNPGPATAGRNAVLRGMADEGYLDRAEAERLAAIPVEVAPPWDRSPSDPYVVEAVKREFLNNEIFGETVSERIELLFAGGLGVHTTVRADLQDAAEHVVAAALPANEGPTAALVALHPVTGGILALHGGRDFDELQFDLATQGRRQPGSALKPVTAAAALQQGLPLSISLPGNGPLTIPVPGAVEPFTVDNFGGQNHGTVDLRGALVNSVNTAFADLIVESGVDRTIDLADRMGINPDRAFGPPNTWGPAIVLGGLTHGVTPLEMASVYSVFANQGVRAGPHLIEKVVDGDGQVIYQREPVGERVIDESVAAAMVDMLTDVVARGTGTGAQFPGVQPLGKTGTTQQNADAWFIGAVPTVSTAVWVGHAEGHVPMPGMTGGSLPATLWREFMQFAVADTDVPAFADATADPAALPGAPPTPSVQPPPPPPPPAAPPAPPPPPPAAPPVQPPPPPPPPPPQPPRAPRPPPPPAPPPQPPAPPPPQPAPPPQPQPQPQPPGLPPATQPPAA